MVDCATKILSKYTLKKGSKSQNNVYDLKYNVTVTAVFISQSNRFQLQDSTFSSYLTCDMCRKFNGDIELIFVVIRNWLLDLVDESYQLLEPSLVTSITFIATIKTFLSLSFNLESINSYFVEHEIIDWIIKSATWLDIPNCNIINVNTKETDCADTPKRTPIQFEQNGSVL